MAGNDPNVHGLGNVKGPAETHGVGAEPKVDPRIQDRGTAAGRVTGRGGTSELPSSDGLQLSDVEDEAPVNSALLQAVSLGSEVDAVQTVEQRQRQALLSRLKELDLHIDETEKRMHDAIEVGDTKTVESSAEQMTELFRERKAATDDLENVGREQPLEPGQDWIDADARGPAAPPQVQAQDGRLVAFIEDELARSESPCARQGAAGWLVDAGRRADVDPLLLLAIAAHETEYGKIGDRLFGVGPPHAPLAVQIGDAAEAFARLRAAGAASASDLPQHQLQAARGAGWSQDAGWEAGVESHHGRLSRAFSS